MENRIKIRTSSLVALIIVSILAVTITMGAILYTLTIPSQWGVNVEYGLELYQNDIKINSIDFGLIDRYGTKTLDFALKNIGNNATATVYLSMPDNTTEYGFSSTFIGGIELARYDFYNFTITLVDFDMDSAIVYSGFFNFTVQG
jgi:hypothetical protein